MGLLVKILAVAILCLLALPAMAGGANDSAPTISEAMLRFKPPLDGLFEATAHSGLRLVSTSVTVSYDELGNVVSVKLDKSTGDKALNRAIRAWAAKVKIETSQAGSGSIPVTMGTGL
jgi:hypothetical protein